MIDLVCAGESFEDLIFADLPRLPRLGEELRAPKFVRTFGGGATITAVAAARLGLRTGIVSALADEAEKRVRDEGVSVKNLRKHHEPHAITAALSTRSERAFVTFDGVNRKLPVRLARALTAIETRHVHLAMTPRDIPAMLRVVKRLRRRGTTVSFDFGYDLDLAKDRRLPALIGAVDLLLINEAEARLYSGARTLRSAESWWRERALATVIKLGAAGSMLITRSATLTAPPKRVQPLDTTGAGDAFNAGYLKALLTGADATARLKLGNLVGALSTRAIGGLDGLPRL